MMIVGVLAPNIPGGDVNLIDEVVLNDDARGDYEEHHKGNCWVSGRVLVATMSVK